jgi:hypothetical protein
LEIDHSVQGRKNNSRLFKNHSGRSIQKRETIRFARWRSSHVAKFSMNSMGFWGLPNRKMPVTLLPPKIFNDPLEVGCSTLNTSGELVTVKFLECLGATARGCEEDRSWKKKDWAKKETHALENPPS